MDSSNQSNVVSFEPGDYVVREKTNCDALYIVKEGQLEVFKTSSSGEKITIGIVSSGQYIGETALLLGRPHSSNVVALTPVKAVRLSKASIDLQLKNVPTWLLALTKGLVDRLQNANDILRRNGWSDEKLSSSARAIEDKHKKKAS